MLIEFITTTRFLKTSDGGRKTPARFPYGPTLFVYRNEICFARLVGEDVTYVPPGGTAKVRLQLPITAETISLKDRINIGDSFLIQDGSQVIANGTIDSILPDPS